MPSHQGVQHNPHNKRIGLALGAGGARGFAHIEVLKIMDELHLTPHMITGSSMGGVIGAVYANGMSGVDIEAYCKSLLDNRYDLAKKIFGRKASKSKYGAMWNPFKSALIDPIGLFEALLPDIMDETFDDTQIKLALMTADFHDQAPYMIEEGPLLPAIAATAALPTIFKAVTIDGHTLIDGGFVDPVPFEALRDTCDFTIGIDVTGDPDHSEDEPVGSWNVMIGASHILMRSLTNKSLQFAPPDIYTKPNVGTYQVLDIFKFDDILADARASLVPFKDELIKKLQTA